MQFGTLDAGTIKNALAAGRFVTLPRERFNDLPEQEVAGTV